MGKIQKKLINKKFFLCFLLILSSVVISVYLVNNDMLINAKSITTVSDNSVEGENEISNTIFISAESSFPSQLPSTSSLTSIKREQPVTNIYLHYKNDTDNVPFQVDNMFPGDKEIHYFNVEVSYKDKVTVHFRPVIHPGGEKLAEVLRCKVVLITTGETLYDGLMKDIPDSLTYSLTSSSKKTDELYYQITTYLDTSVGNEYMNKNLEADFHWWVEETSNLEPRPETGYNLYIYLLGALGCGILFVLTIFSKRFKEGK